MLSGNLDEKASLSSSESASPLLLQYFSSHRPPGESSILSNRDRSNEGTSTRREICSDCRIRASLRTSLTASSPIITVRTPCSNGPNISHNESRKFKDVFWQATSPLVKG